MDDLILTQSKKLRRRVEEKLRQCKVEDLIKIADDLGVSVQPFQGSTSTFFYSR
jgi:hypothetical protein